MRIIIAAVLCLLVQPGQATTAGSMLDDPAVQEYIKEVSEIHGLDQGKLTGLFDRVYRQQSVIDRISKPAERVLEWHEYAPIFLTHKRVRAGVEFARKHAELLADVEDTYQVPAEIITAIIGVETFFGQYTGKDTALPALATLAFAYPPRAGFFRQELTQFLLLANEEKLDPSEIKGSYAAAMGMPQFISSSYRRYAVDFDQDGQRDLWNSPADVIASVANYFKQHGWQAGEPIAERVYPGTSDYRQLLSAEGKPTLSVADLSARGVHADTQSAGPKMLMEFKLKHGHETWLGHHNFYVITRYNHSQMYALAVFQLSQALKASGA